MLENIQKIIPEMDKNDSQSFYNQAIKSKQQTKVTLPKKLIISFASIMIFLAIIIPVSIKVFDGNGGTHSPEILPPEPGNEEVPHYNLQGTIIEFYDCYFGENSDVLVLFFPDITLWDIYIKEADNQNKILNVEIKDDSKKVTFENNVYTVDVHNLKEAYITIHFVAGTLKGNQITQSEDKPIEVDEYHESHTTNITKLTFLCSIIMSDAGYETVTYVKNIDTIKNEPLILLTGVAASVEEAMELVGIERVLVFNQNDRMKSIVYNKNNSRTEVIVDYDVNDFITIKTIVKKEAFFNEIVKQYVDTSLYILDNNYTNHLFDNELSGNLYVCYKNDEQFQSAVAVLEYSDADYFFVVEINLYGEDLDYSFIELINNTSFIN